MRFGRAVAGVDLDGTGPAPVGHLLTRAVAHPHHQRLLDCDLARVGVRSGNAVAANDGVEDAHPLLRPNRPTPRQGLAVLVAPDALFDLDDGRPSDGDRRRAGLRHARTTPLEAPPRARADGRQHHDVRRFGTGLRSDDVPAVFGPQGPGKLELDEGEAALSRRQSSLRRPVGSSGMADLDGLIGTVGLSISPRRSISLSHWEGLSTASSPGFPRPG